MKYNESKLPLPLSPLLLGIADGAQSGKDVSREEEGKMQDHVTAITEK